jgi:hypothetical protein
MSEIMRECNVLRPDASTACRQCHNRPCPTPWTCAYPGTSESASACQEYIVDSTVALHGS